MHEHSYQVHHVCSSLDDQISEAIRYTLDGWPKYFQDVDDHLKSFYEHRSHFSVAHGLLLYDNRIVLPTCFRAEMVDRIHQGHQGVNKCVDRASYTVWWPGITRDIKLWIERCEHCQKYRSTQESKII
jgi:hypothetical protein